MFFSSCIFFFQADYVIRASSPFRGLGIVYKRHTWHRIASHGITSHGITWHHIASHGITWHGIIWHHMASHGITWHHMASHDWRCCRSPTSSRQAAKVPHDMAWRHTWRHIFCGGEVSAIETLRRNHTGIVSHPL